MADARETAVRALMAVDRGAWSDLTLAASIRKAGLDARDAALCTAICAGVLQNRALLDYQIAAYSSLRLNKISPFVLNVLRAAACQIIFLDRVPDSAAVNTAVAMIRRSANPKAAGFANAVLRRISEHADDWKLPDVQDRTNYLSVRYSHPAWLVEYLEKRLGPEAEEALAANNVAPPVTARVNTLKTDREEAMQALTAEGVEVRDHPFLQDALILAHSGSIEALSAFRTGMIAIQDAASQLDVLALDPQPGEQLLDMCAAPGGKTFAAAARMQNRGGITACDIYEQRLGLIQRDALRLGAEIVTAALSDGTVPNPAFAGRFDRVLVDAPCSGMGVIRRKPEIRYKSPEEIAGLPAVQNEILKNAASALKKGGIMIYSTCSVMEDENESVIRNFLAQQEDFTAVPFTLPGGIQAPEGMLTLWPHRNGTDGFFISKLMKRN